MKRYLSILMLIIILLLTGVAFAENAEKTKLIITDRLITIKWQRLVSKGETCPRCGSTEKEVEKAYTLIKRSLSPLNIEVKLEKKEISVSKFSKAPLESNKIWVNGLLLEKNVDGKTCQSKCEGVCGPSDCRAIEVDGKVYETIPANFIIKACLIEAARIVGSENEKYQ